MLSTSILRKNTLTSLSSSIHQASPIERPKVKIQNILYQWNCPCTENEWKAIKKFFVRAYATAYDGCSLEELSIDKSKWKTKEDYFSHCFEDEKQKILDPYFRKINYLIAYFQDIPVGFMVCEINPKSARTYLRWVTMNPDFHNIGLGTAMLKKIEKYFPESLGMELYSREANKIAKNFYTKYGFKTENKMEFDFSEPENQGEIAKYVTTWTHHQDSRYFFPKDEAVDSTEVDHYRGFYKDKHAVI